MTDSQFVEEASVAVQSIVDEAPSESNLVAHARRELELIGEDDQEWIDGLVKIVQAFADMGHSGGSASVAIPMINLLLQFKNLMPLTDDPDEWIHHTEELWPEPGGIWQNVRNGEAFSSDGGITYTLLSDKKHWLTRRKPVHISAPSGKR